MAKRKFTPPEICPICGEDVPRNALACPECGADEQTGWKEGADSIGLAPTDEEFDYDKFVADEFGMGSPRKRIGISPFWWVVGVLILFGMLWGLVNGVM